MPFPSSPREIYKVNPLNEVICQLRYPAILKISGQKPFEFQDKIRGTYPIYEEKNGLAKLSSALPKELSALLAAVPIQPPGESLEHHFSTEDQSRSITLTQEFVAITEKHYGRWEDFCASIQSAESVLYQIYNPNYYVRIGLRYVDVLERSSSQLSDTPWSELLNPAFISMLGEVEIASDVEELQIETLLNIPDVENGRVKIKHGLARNQETTEQVYLIDADFHSTGRNDTDGAIRDLERFNRWAGYLFRWATSDKLRMALGRHPI